MRQRCEYCDSWIEDTDEVCPHCGAPNAHMMASAEGVPKTIEELKDFCARHNLPLKDMRVFIGEDFKGPRAFGIYRDGEDVIVYKNKANGERAVRYRGHDEAYAVNELYQKMKSEIANQRMHQAKAKESGQQTPQSKGNPGKGRKKRRGKRRSLSIRDNLDVIIVFAVLAAAVGWFVYILFFTPNAGYYTYQDTTYYYRDSGWYYYDPTASSWMLDDDPPTTLVDNYDDYYTSYDWDDSVGGTDFRDSPYYTPPSSSDDSDDDGWSWDWDSDWDDDDWDWDSSDSWDSGYTDWDSDW